MNEPRLQRTSGGSPGWDGLPVLTAEDNQEELQTGEEKDEDGDEDVDEEEDDNDVFSSFSRPFSMI